MKYIKSYKESILVDPKEWLDNRNVKNYVINADGTIDVSGNVEISSSGIRGKLRVKFGKVTGNFDISYNHISNLEGCPNYVGGDFIAHSNDLKKLVGGPEEVGGSYNVCCNKLITLEGCAIEIGKNLYVDNNLLKQIDITSSIGGDIHCFHNRIPKICDGFNGWCGGKIFYREEEAFNVPRIVR